MITEQQFKMLLPLACAWAQEQETQILRDGVSLTQPQIADAKRAGVTFPEKVKLLSVRSIPLPNHPTLRAAVDSTQLVTSDTAGLTLRYGIFIRTDCWNDRSLLVHELVHTSQYERLGGFESFLSRYLYECITIGYPAAPLEQEAIMTAAKLCP